MEKLESYIPDHIAKTLNSHITRTMNLGFIKYTTELIEQRRPKNRIEITIDTSDEKQAMRIIKKFKDTMLDTNTHL